MGEFLSPQPEEYKLGLQEPNLSERQFDDLKPRKRESHRMLNDLFDYASRIDQFENQFATGILIDPPLNNARCLAQLAIVELARTMNLNTTRMIKKIDIPEQLNEQVLNQYERAKQLATVPQSKKDLAANRLLQTTSDPKLREIDRYIMGVYESWMEEEKQKRNELVPSAMPAGGGQEGTPALNRANFTPEQLKTAEQDFDRMIGEVHEEESRKALEGLTPEEILEGQEEVGMTGEIHDEFSHNPTLPPNETAEN